MFSKLLQIFNFLSVTSAVSSTTPNQLVKVQLPKSTIQIQPTTRLTLAPKPGTVSTTSTSSATPTRIVIPANTATAATSAPKCKSYDVLLLLMFDGV